MVSIPRCQVYNAISSDLPVGAVTGSAGDDFRGMGWDAYAAQYELGVSENATPPQKKMAA